MTNCMVINVDGNVCGTPTRGGFSGCYRSNSGQWQGGFFGYRDDTCILHLELLAIFNGLSIAWERGCRVVECQLDTLNAVTLVKSKPTWSHLYASLVWDIIEMLQRPWRVELHHILREENACADELAKHRAHQEEAFFAIENPLEGMSFLLLADVVGNTVVRE
ncbi:uncharacterized protein LOC130718968 [Lotus japonicus]|uniref:uncharacterized protein LOC130718968 n=1 Tax=Lotus japonicus TaxID=34305 RepID=UPI002582FF8E|nr:uncharacterized protein LOC130718968 [Lotus japonicus]